MDKQALEKIMRLNLEIKRRMDEVRKLQVELGELDSRYFTWSEADMNTATGLKASINGSLKKIKEMKEEVQEIKSLN